MEVHIIYIDIIIISIFSKITFLFTENYGFLIFTGLVKIIYKVGSYIRAKRRAESWETNKLDHLGNMVLAQHPRKSKKGSKTREVDKSHNGKNIDHVHNERRTRLNTVMQVKLVENVKVEETRKKNRIEHSNNFMLKFALTEISEITFGLGLIFLAIFFQFFENSSVFISLEDKQVMTYLLSLGCELFISVLSIILLLVFWVRKSKMIDLKFAQIIKPPFRNYFINHCVIYTTFFLFSLSIIQVFYGKLCCIDI